MKYIEGVDYNFHYFSSPVSAFSPIVREEKDCLRLHDSHLPPFIYSWKLVQTRFSVKKTFPLKSSILIRMIFTKKNSYINGDQDQYIKYSLQFRICFLLTVGFENIPKRFY